MDGSRWFFGMIVGADGAASCGQGGGTCSERARFAPVHPRSSSRTHAASAKRSRSSRRSTPRSPIRTRDLAHDCKPSAPLARGPNLVRRIQALPSQELEPPTNPPRFRISIRDHGGFEPFVGEFYGIPEMESWRHGFEPDKISDAAQRATAMPAQVEDGDGQYGCVCSRQH